ncbi:pentatricopeptide repeat-containing protein At2g18940, chloroplastic-like [Solanum pennellii]|uniref:Pentatricopeptide repeat-containing protein At2g18940, chloroplastic-like n=1 Tax=Solanum pennellii TaxID=28526 RepID=A0ABM1HA34_SOLPN|nr:pentatricopeptide repeat-containing protein At2g18940, chloroplastic-like [Solanum pennellii]XP_015082569.1 pentatricopeptide repeat-containing protein At2g18940, chloroplastic-like [Solanum pennellii]XP_015082570.1 pentatricopeptide repeat-containing protein At2g18940, chloroplastic-like [Solanum pennellii]
MNMKQLMSKRTIEKLSKLKATEILCHFHSKSSIPTSSLPPSTSWTKCRFFQIHNTPIPKFESWSAKRLIHTDTVTDTPEEMVIETEEMVIETEDDITMNDFLSRFVWIMRGKLKQVYPDFEKKTIDEMLLVIVDKVVSELEKGGFDQIVGGKSSDDDFSHDLWKTVWEVSNVVLEDMEKAKRKDKMKNFLQAEQVKEMCRFAGEVGIRGDMLREYRFKWAREKMEETEFYHSLERFKEEEQQQQGTEHGIGESRAEDPKLVTLPKRRGKINYKIYGLDLSDSKWSQVADKIHEAEKIICPQEPKKIDGKCKIITEKLLSLQEEDDYSPLIAEWVQLLQPSRVDWINLLDRLQNRNPSLYLKIAEHVLGEESFETNIRDYSKLIDAHARDNRREDAERIIRKMRENGIVPDILTSTTMVHMYSKAGDLDRAKAAFESLRTQGFLPDMGVYNSMILAYVNAGDPKKGESLMKEMEVRDMKPSKKIYMALLRSFSQHGDANGAQRIATSMQFSGFQPTLESCMLLVEAFGKAGDPDQARQNFDYMIKLGHKPDDRCTATMIAAYEKNNLLDKALNLLIELEIDGFEPGVATYSVLVDWLSKMQLIDEAEQLLDKIAEQGEAPPFKVHISLCDMYARANVEKKALQALGVLEAKQEQLEPEDFERIIWSLIAGGFVQDAQKFQGLMEARGFTVSEQLQVTLMASQTFLRRRPSVR